jgi:hypothetical protein
MSGQIPNVHVGTNTPPTTIERAKGRIERIEYALSKPTVNEVKKAELRESLAKYKAMLQV